MRSVAVRIAVLGCMTMLFAVPSMAFQTRLYDPVTKTWKEVPQSFKGNGIIMLFKPGGDNSKAIAAVDFNGKIDFMSTGVVSGENALLSIRKLSPPGYDPSTPGTWQKITKSELVQGRVVITTDSGETFTLYGFEGNFTAWFEPGRVIPEPPKPDTNK